MTQDLPSSVDLLVVGAGMAGLTTAAAAASAGARVLVVEKGNHAGGSAIYAGFAWTAPTYEVLREVNPLGDAALGARLIEGFPGGVDWIRAREGGVVPGLLAAGADAGGLYHSAYAGGLAAALVFGLTAARTATRDPS